MINDKLNYNYNYNSNSNYNYNYKTHKHAEGQRTVRMTVIVKENVRKNAEFKNVRRNASKSDKMTKRIQRSPLDLNQDEDTSALLCSALLFPSPFPSLLFSLLFTLCLCFLYSTLLCSALSALLFSSHFSSNLT